MFYHCYKIFSAITVSFCSDCAGKSLNLNSLRCFHVLIKRNKKTVFIVMALIGSCLSGTAEKVKSSSYKIFCRVFFQIDGYNHPYFIVYGLMTLVYETIFWTSSLLLVDVEFQNQLSESLKF